MLYQVVTTSVVTVEFSEEEAKWLHAVMQNRLGPEEPTEKEDEHRRALFDTLNGARKIILESR